MILNEKCIGHLVNPRPLGQAVEKIKNKGKTPLRRTESQLNKFAKIATGPWDSRGSGQIGVREIY